MSFDTLGSYSRIQDIHISRTQREAGIEDLPWADRIAPKGSWLETIAAGIVTLVAICIMAILVSVL